MHARRNKRGEVKIWKHLRGRGRTLIHAREGIRGGGEDMKEFEGMSGGMLTTGDEAP